MKKIFVSYAWESENNLDKKVKEFTQWLTLYLRKWGFDVSLDVFENRPGSKLSKFMEEGINESRFVICVCTETYLNKIKQPGTGVHTEIELLKKRADSPFIIPVIEKGKFMNLPDFFDGKFVSELKFDTPYSIENQKPIFELISTIRDEVINIEDVKIEARIESYYNDIEKLKFRSKAEDLMQFEPQSNNRVTFQYLLNDKEFKIGIPPMEFLTRWSTADANSIHSYNKVEEVIRVPDIGDLNPINKPRDLFKLNSKSTLIKWSTNLKIGDGIAWINKDGFMAIGKIIEINIDEDDEYKNTVTLDYKILNPIDITDDFVQDATV